LLVELMVQTPFDRSGLMHFSGCTSTLDRNGQIAAVWCATV
jgi:hypothetical protein